MNQTAARGGSWLLLESERMKVKNGTSLAGEPPPDGNAAANDGDHSRALGEGVVLVGQSAARRLAVRT